MPAAAQQRSVDPRLARILYGCFIVSGAAGLLYEVVWSALLSNLVGGTTTTHTVVLAAFMGGLALGNRFGGRWADRHGFRGIMALAAVVATVGFFWLYLFINISTTISKIDKCKDIICIICIVVE